MIVRTVNGDQQVSGPSTGVNRLATSVGKWNDAREFRKESPKKKLEEEIETPRLSDWERTNGDF